MSSSRALSTGFITALQADHVSIFALMEFGFDSGMVYVAGLAHDVAWNGHTYLASLGVMAIGNVAEDGAQSDGLQITLACATPGSIGMALGEPVQGRSLVLRMAAIDATGTLQVDLEAWAGTMDTLRIVDTVHPTIVITAESRTAAWQRARLELYSDAWQQSLNPGDISLRYMSQIENAQVVWPDKTFFQQ
jgi:hypothetical protein